MSRRTPRNGSTPRADAHSRSWLTLALVVVLSGCMREPNARVTASPNEPRHIASQTTPSPPLPAAPSARSVLASEPAARPTAATHAPESSASPRPSPSESGPQLYSVSALPAVAHAGDAVKFDAHVSRDVVSVTARVAVYSFEFSRLRFGHYGETLSIPTDVPPFFRGNYSVTITAKNAAGASASRSLALSFQ